MSKQNRINSIAYFLKAEAVNFKNRFKHATESIAEHSIGLMKRRSLFLCRLAIPVALLLLGNTSVQQVFAQSGNTGSVIPVISFKETRVHGTLTDTAVEGSWFSFFFESDRDWDEDFSFNVEIVEDGSFIKNSPSGSSDFIRNIATGPHPVIMRSGKRLARIRVATTDDNANEFNGTITARAVPGEGYVVDLANDTGRVTVEDNDDTWLSIRGDNVFRADYQAREQVAGSPVRFRITVENPAQRETPVYLRFTDTAGILDHPLSLTITVRPRQAIYTVILPVHEYRNRTGSVTATILEDRSGTGSYLLAEHLENSATVNIVRNYRYPEISYKETRINGSVGFNAVEGDRITFVYNVNIPGRLALNVPVRLTETSGSFLAASTPRIYQMVLSRNTSQTSFSFRTHDDEVDELRGQITATILPGHHLIIGRDSRSVTVSDNDDTRVSIFATGGSPIPGDSEYRVLPGDTANFRVAVTPVPEEDIPVKLLIIYNLDNDLGDDIDEITTYKYEFQIVNIPSNVSELIYPVETDANEAGTMYNNITVVVRSHPTDSKIVYRPMDEERVARATVKKLPMVSFDYVTGGISSNNTAIEGQTLRFRFRADQEEKVDYKINVRVRDRGTFVARHILRIHQIVMRASNTSVWIDVPTLDDSVDELNALVIARLLDGPGYVVNSSNRRGLVNVLDNDETVVSIEAVESTVKVENAANFILTVNPVAVVEIPVRIMIRQVANVVADSDLDIRIVNVPANSGEILYSVPTVDDGNTGLGSIQISVLENDAGPYVYSLHSTNSNASVEVDKRPVISFKETRVQNTLDDSAIEGDYLTFVFETDRVRNQNFDIRFKAKETGSFIRSGGMVPNNESDFFLLDVAGDSLITLSAGHRYLNIRVPTADDNVDEENGTVSVELYFFDYVDYIVDSSDRIGSVAILDNDETLVSLEMVEAAESAGNTVEFKLVIVPMTQDVVPVRIDLRQTGNVLTESAGTKRYNVPANASEWTVSLPTSVGTVGEVTAVLLQPSGGPNIYTPASALVDRTVTVQVVSGVVPPLISFKESRIGDRVTDVGYEGDMFVFVFEGDRNPPPNTSVVFEIREQGSFIGGTFDESSSFPVVATTGTHSVSMQSRQLRLGVATRNDNVDEMDGSFTVELLDSADYFINSRSSNTVTVRVRDNDDTTVSIVRSAQHVEAGTDASFTLVLSPLTEEEFQVNVGLTDFGGVLLGGNQNIVVDVPAGISELDISVATVDTDRRGSGQYLDTFLGTIKATVLDSTSASNIYRVTENEHERSFFVTIVEKDSLPTISFKKTRIGYEQTDTGTEGNIFTFIFEADSSPPNLVFVDFEVVETGSFVSASNNLYAYTYNGFGRNPNAQENNGLVSINIRTDDDDLVESNGTITVRILPGYYYKVDSSNNSGKVTVMDNDGTVAGTAGIQELLPADSELASFTPSDLEKTVLSIAAISNSITEGETASFEISASAPPTSTITVQLNVEIGNGYLIEGDVPEFMQFPAGSDSLHLNIPTRDDDLEEPDGKIRVSIVQGGGYDLAVSASSAETEVMDNDAKESFDVLTARLISDVQPVLLRTMGIQSQDAIGSRLRSAFSEPGGTSIRLSGHESLKAMFVHGGEMANQDDLDWSSLLQGTRFEIELFPEDGIASAATFWGQGDFQNVSSTDGLEGFNWNGDLYSGHAGLDARITNDVLAGVSVTSVKGEIEFTETNQDTEFSGNHHSGMTLIQPYFGWHLPENDVGINVGTGFGQGSVAIQRNGGASEVLASNMMLAHVNGNGLLHTIESDSENSRSELKLDGTVWGARQLVSSNRNGINGGQFNARHLRLDVVGNQYVETDAASNYNPSFSVGIIWNGGDGNLTSGVLSNGTLNYQHWSGLSSSVSSTLMLDESFNESKYGLNGRIQFEFGNTTTALDLDYVSSQNLPSATILPANRWLTAIDRTDGLLNNGRLKMGIEFERKIRGSARRIIFGNSMLFSDNGNREYNLASRILVNENFRIGTEINRKIEIDGSQEYKLGLTNSIQW